ncbi:IclR family transcriptional regulator [Pollutimonas sp. M17]|uniref:IclR family transcriptional regulator n=1 Tax=Pollutimonas sp. M17 TaxID=2962065 RepID=UPI0021F4A500|nr:IclR family transcriptional regulator [Pollutimonas sp. M17]UYO93309.1 IclR family transcriptional regulator [Pollutimonas sp. M17]HWK72265.1 IclR family transcriptional regulator [Burkholderiaceae bacterium]
MEQEQKAKDKQSEKSGEGVRAVDRALDVLAAFEPGDSELLVADLVKRVGLSRPTLYRLLHTLESKGFVASSGEPQRFRLGPAVARLAHVWSSTLDLSEIARPVMAEAWALTAETVALFVPRGDMRLCVAEMQSPQPISFRRGVGYSEKLVRGASGRAILAFTPLKPGQLEAYAAGTNADLGWLTDQLRVTRERGYAMGHNELIQGAYAVAAPFFDRSGTVAGSLGVFGPDVRLTEARMHEFGLALCGMADQLTKNLGGMPPS